MNKRRIKNWQELRAELRAISGVEAVRLLDQHLEQGRKVSAIALLRKQGVQVED